MKYCKYHPLTAATYHCETCNTTLCDKCVDDSSPKAGTYCLSCDKKVVSLGAKYNADAFWRRLEESFHYPLNKGTIVFIVVMAFLTTIASFLPFAFIWYLMLTGAFMKYCFTCLEKTARGSNRAPDITAAYDGGIILALQLLAIVVIVTAVITGIYFWLGVGMATFIGAIIICCIPAILINFAFTEQILEAINPLKILTIISAVGLPYGLLLALIMVMMGSVGVINQLIGNELSLLSISLQSVVSNYYTIVTFHIMGYMIFQYQDRFGFTAVQEDHKKTKARSSAELAMARIDITIKEGDYNKAIELFCTAIKKESDNKTLCNNYFEFLLAIKNKERIDEYASFYFRFLNENQREDLINLSYKKILRAYPHFMPNNPEDRIMLAKECKQSGDPRSALKLLNGIKKAHPQYNRLEVVYALMAEALRDIPNMATKAEQFAALSQRVMDSKQKQARPKKRGKRLPPKNIEQKSVVETIEDNAKKENAFNYDGGIDFS